MKIDMMVLGGVVGAEFPTTPATRASSTGVIFGCGALLTALCTVSGFQLFVHSPSRVSLFAWRAVYSWLVRVPDSS